MKKRRNDPDELRREYKPGDLHGGVRGKYYARAITGTNLVLIEPEIAEVFPTSAAVNNALRRLIRSKSPSRGGRRGSRTQKSGAHAHG